MSSHQDVNVRVIDGSLSGVVTIESWRTHAKLVILNKSMGILIVSRGRGAELDGEEKSSALWCTTRSTPGRSPPIPANMVCGRVSWTRRALGVATKDSDRRGAVAAGSWGRAAARWMTSSRLRASNGALHPLPPRSQLTTA
ncbi:hypothetical protein ZWY2020_009745 [Hordeum vulgare]|nr:hypothetical protein ZWY2020_009745 [Hordeum vulgare]